MGRFHHLKNHLPAPGPIILHPQNGVAHTKDLYSIERGDDANHESATSRPIEHTNTSVEFLEQPHKSGSQDMTENSHDTQPPARKCAFGAMTFYSEKMSL